MGYEITEPLYETAERDGTVVKADDPRARFLIGVPGQTLSDEEAKRLGLGPDTPVSKAVHSAEVADKAIDGPKAKRGAE